MAVQFVTEQPDLDNWAGDSPEIMTEARSVPDWRVQSRRNALQLHLLGSTELSLDGRRLVPRTRKTLALLAYLAVQGGRQPREYLADLFWPAADIDDARASLRTTLSYLRQALGSNVDAYLLTTRESVGLLPSAPLELDVQGLTETQRVLRRSTEPRLLRRQVEAAVERYHGPFLEGLCLPDAPDFEVWVEGQLAHWRRVAAALLEHLATLQLQDGDTGTALTSLERWTTVDPDEESAWKQLIDVHLRCEDRSGARRAWKGYREVLDELDDLLGDPWLAELARPLPELRVRYPDLSASVDDPALARGRLFEAMARLGHALGERRPLVFCLDDVQWTDVDTRDLLRYALRRWTDAGTPILLILAVRSEDLGVDCNLAQWLAALERETPTLHLTMGALQPEDVVALLARLPSAPLRGDDDAQTDTVVEFGSWLAARTGGHPLSLAEAIRTLLEESVLQVRPVGDDGWAVHIPDLLHGERIDWPDSMHLADSPVETTTERRESSYSTTSTPRHGRVVYPMAAADAARTLAPAG